MKKKLLLVLLLVMFFPFIANADSVEVNSFSDLMEKNVAGTTIDYTGTSLDLTQDLNLVATLRIKANTTMNLNNHTLTLSGHGGAYGIAVFDSLTINGNGTVKIEDNYGITTSISGTPKLVINGGTFTHSGDYLIGLTNGEVVINNGTFTSSYCVVNNFAGYYRTNYSQYSNANGKLTINNGTFSTTEEYGAPIMNSDVVIIKGGTFTSSGTEGNAVWTEAPGNTTIEDGTFNSTGTDSEIIGNDEGTVTINGGTFGEATVIKPYIPESSTTYTNTTGMEVVVPKDELVVKAFDAALEPTEEQTTMVNDALEKGFVVGKFYDITAWLVNPNDENAKVEQVTEVTNAVKVTLAIPTDLPAVQKGYTRTYKVIRIHDGKTTVINAVDNGDGTISFTTDAFSPYALTYADQAPAADEDATEQTNHPKTADKIILYISALVISATAVTGTALYLNKRY